MPKLTLGGGDAFSDLCRRLHRRLWLWLARHPDKFKDDWPGWKRKYVDEATLAAVKRAAGYNHCFACAACDVLCRICPLFGTGNPQDCAQCGRHPDYQGWCVKRTARFTDSLRARRAKRAKALADMAWTRRTLL